jgi:hypothetical protein
MDQQILVSLAKPVHGNIILRAIMAQPQLAIVVVQIDLHCKTSLYGNVNV